MQSQASLIPNLDHLVIAAANLTTGVDYIRQALDVDIPYGGQHPQMGTHNHLMRIGEQIFLEVIAVNSDAEQPTRPRWYGLDDPFVRESISQQPRLVGWVVNTTNISDIVSKARFAFGQPELISRGNLSWHFCLPEDGRLLAGGLVPYVMKWNTEVHPAASMADCGCKFQKIDLYHPNASWLRSILEKIRVDHLVTVNDIDNNQTAYMIASINTPSGLKQLSSKLTHK